MAVFPDGRYAGSETGAPTEEDGPLGERALPSYRVVPAGTAWYRLGPDKFFSQAEPVPNIAEGEMCRGGKAFGLRSFRTGTNFSLPVGVCRFVPLQKKRSVRAKSGAWRRVTTLIDA
jgi:hypothetical protein